MLRRLPPPDFRYVWLSPGQGSVATTLAGPLGAVAMTAVFCSAIPQPLVAALAGTAAASAFFFARKHRHLPLRRGAREVTMAIVPWGILVTPDTDPRVLRWPAIQQVEVDVTHTLRGGTPAIISSLVTVQTEQDVLAGRANGAVELERLMANLKGYAEEASRLVASDLDGLTPLGDGVIEPIAAALFRAADHICGTSDGAVRLALPPGGYRAAAARVAAPETVAQLRFALEDSFGCPFDPRPLAAILAGMLDARELVPDLLQLATSPHPVVAVFAKAAALCLGAPPNRAGSLDELSSFLFEEDLELAKRWVPF